MLENTLNKIIKYSIYLLVFMMPLYWLPYTFEIYEFNKLYLLFYVSVIAFAAWLIKMFVAEKRIILRRTPLDIGIFIFLLIIIVASIFAKDTISSWFGFYGRNTDSTVGLISLLIMYFVIVNNTAAIKGANSSRAMLKKIINIIVVSSVFVISASYFAILDLWHRIPLVGSNLPSIMNLKTFNPTSNSAEGLSIYLAYMTAIVVGLILINFLLKERKKTVIEERKSNIIIKALYSLGRFKGLFYFIILILNLVLLIKINFKAAWISLGVAMLLMLVIAFWTKIFRSKINSLVLPIIILLISISAMFINFQQFLGWSDLPNEVILDYKTTKTISWQSFKENPILGSGPGNFYYSFNKFKPVEFNESSFWNIRFDKAPSHIIELVVTTGALGVIAYLVIILLFIVAFFKAINNLKNKLFGMTKYGERSSTLLLSIPLLIGLAALITGQALYLGNLTLFFAFWSSVAFVFIAWHEGEAIKLKKIRYSFDLSPELGLVLTTILVLLVFVFLSVFYMAGKFYMADANQGKLTKEENQDIEKQIAIMEESVDLNKYRVNYKISLSRLYFTRAWNEARKNQDERDLELLTNLAGASTRQAQSATQISPNLVSVWENSGIIWRDLRALVTGAGESSISSFEKAIELEPVNPLFYRELCRLYLVSDTEEEWDKTLNTCQTAIDLKPNYIDAYVQLALAYEKKNDIEEGIKKLEAALERVKGVRFEQDSQLAGAVAEIYFQMARLHFSADRSNKAIEMFQQAIILIPSHSNARYGLATVYEKKGMIGEAIEQYKIVQQLNPDNQIVKEKIESLSRPAPVVPDEELEDEENREEIIEE